MNVYFISGLGADKRAFEKLTLPPGFTPQYIDWIAPKSKEVLEAYAKRMAVAIDVSKPFALVGLSMGGMLAAALAPVLRPAKTILISSVASAGEFPPLFKILRRTKAHRLLPLAVINKPNFITAWLFGAKTKKEKELLNYLTSHADSRFIKWAIEAMVNWKQQKRLENIYQIHGSADKILPLKYTAPNAVVQGGSHFMVWTKAGEVSKHLAAILSA